MLGSVLTTLVADQTTTAASKVTKRHRKKQRETRISEELNPIETEFSEALGNQIEARAQELESFALQNIAHHWDVVFEEINAFQVAFESEADAVKWLCEEIEAADAVDSPLDEKEQAELRELIASTYADALETFHETVANDEELANRLQTELQADIRDRLEIVIENFNELAVPQSYDLYEFPADREAILERINVNRDAEFVARPGLVPEEPTCERHIVLGPSGSGKSRIIAERLARLPDSAIGYVLVPQNQLLSTADIQALTRESFDEDLLLIWEDVHRIDGGREDGVVRNVLTKLEATLNDDGQRLHALLEAQSGRLEDVFGSHPADFTNEKSLWHTFEPLWVDEVDADARRQLVERFADRFAVSLDSDVRDQLVARTDNAPSAPVYIETVFKTAGSELTPPGLADIDEKVAAIWNRQYEHLRDESDAEWRVLAAMKYLHDLGVTTFSKLVYRVFCDHLDGDRERFRPAIKSLTAQRRWVNITDRGGGLIAPKTTLYAHDTQLTPVGVRAQDDAAALSEIIRDSITTAVPSDAQSAVLFNSGQSLQNLDYYNLAAAHYEQGLEIDPDDAIAHYDYARLYMEFDEPDQASTHYEKALSLNPRFAEAHCNYGNLLYEKQNKPQEALDHFEKAIEINPDLSLAHASYGVVLSEEFDKLAQAENHFEQAIDSNSEHANIYTSFGQFVIREYDDGKRARDLYEQALEIDSSCLEAHHKYALLLQDFFELPNKAAKQYELAIEIDPDKQIVYFDYALLLATDLKSPDLARDYFDKAITKGCENADIHFNYGLLLKNKLQMPNEARTQFQQALEIDPNHIGAYLSYARLLINEFETPEAATDLLQQAIAADEPSPKAHLEYASLLQNEFNDPQQAADQYEAAIEIEPENNLAHYNYANLLKNELAKPQQAGDHYAKAINADPAHAEAHTNFAILLADNLEKPEQAKQHFESALENDPDLFQANYKYAQFLREELSNDDQAASYYENALRIALTDASAQIQQFALQNTPMILEVLEEVDRIDTAVELYQDAIEQCDQPGVSFSTKMDIKSIGERLTRLQ